MFPIFIFHCNLEADELLKENEASLFTKDTYTQIEFPKLKKYHAQRMHWCRCYYWISLERLMNLFLETYNYLNEMDISYLHVFTYSERPNTEAVAYRVVLFPKKLRAKRSKMLTRFVRQEKTCFL